MIANGYLLDWPDTIDHARKVDASQVVAKSLSAATLMTPARGTIGQTHVQAGATLPVARWAVPETTQMAEA